MLHPIAAAVAAGLFSLAPDAAMSATLQVGVNGCTLANAILNANSNSNTDGASGCIAGSGADIITLPSGSTQTLNAALPDVTSAITIEGNGSTIRRGSTAPAFRIFTVTEAANLTLKRATISGGLVAGETGGGGGINSAGILKLDRSIVTGNTAVGGAGIYAKGRTTLIDSVVSANNATTGSSAGAGGGIFSFLGDLSLVRSTVSSNRAASGGGLFATGGTLTITDSTISGNRSDATADVGAGGGGLIAVGLAPLVGAPDPIDVTIINSTISGNVTGGIGGGVVLSLASLALTDSSIAGNTASEGGGVIQFNGDSTLSRSLISGNVSTSGSAGEFDLRNVADLPTVPPGSVITNSYTCLASTASPVWQASL